MHYAATLRISYAIMGCCKLAVGGQCPGGRPCVMEGVEQDGWPAPALLVKASEVLSYLTGWSKAATPGHERQADVRIVVQWLGSDSPGLRHAQRKAWTALSRLWRVTDVFKPLGGGQRLNLHQAPAPRRQLRGRVLGTSATTPATLLPPGRMHRTRSLDMPGVREEALPGTVPVLHVPARRAGSARRCGIAMAGAEALPGVEARSAGPLSGGIARESTAGRAGAGARRGGPSNGRAVMTDAVVHSDVVTPSAGHPRL